MKRILTLSFLLIAFGGTYLFTRYKSPPVVAGYCDDQEMQCGHYILARPDVYFDKASHVFLLGVRAFMAVAVLLIWFNERCLSYAVTGILFVLYFFDYWIFFNDPIPGFPWSYSFVLGGVIVILILYEIGVLIKRFIYGNS